MSDLTFTANDFLSCDKVLASLSTNLEIHFQLEGSGENWDRDTMQEHVRKRLALGMVRLMCIDEAERVAGLNGKEGA